VARLGRSFPVNWILRNRPPADLAIPAAATLPAGISLTAGANVSGSAVLAEITNVGPVSIPPATAELDAGISLAPGGLVTSNALLTAETSVAAFPQAWLFTGTVPLAYPQYLEPGGSLAVTPGQAVVAMGAASGWPYGLAVPPPDGRWIALGGGGHVLEAEAPAEEEEPDLSWDPPPHLAHLPVPFSLVAERIARNQRRRVVVSRD